MATRRQFLRVAGLAGAGLGCQALLPAWARGGEGGDYRGLPALHGTRFDLAIARTAVQIDGRPGRAVTINGTIPAPLLRWREGDTVTLNVANRLDEDTSIHWHGILLPPAMDGVPGLSFPGIRPGETFTYRFPVRQAGTYWYHSHSGMQEQIGHYGPLIIDPAGADPNACDREYVVMLSDWTFEDPHRVLAKLKKKSNYYNFQQVTLPEVIAGGAPAWREWRAWGAMRMNPADIADVTGATYRYLLNGQGPGDNWTGLYRPGERVRLRLINGSAMTYFNVRIPGLPMTVVQADGQDVAPVETDELQMAVAETLDVLVTPGGNRAYTLFAEAMDRSGYARGTLAPRPGMQAPVPALRRPVRRTMVDMGMDHGAGGHGGHGGGESGSGQDMAVMNMAVMNTAGTDHGAWGHDAMGHGAAPAAHGTDHAASAAHGTDHDDRHAAAGGMDHGAMGHAAMDHAAIGHDSSAAPQHGAGGMDHASMDHARMGHAEPGAGRVRSARPGRERAAPGPVLARHGADSHGVGNQMVATVQRDRTAEAGTGLADEAHRVLVYADLRARTPAADARAPSRTLELHLTGHMDRYMWSFDGRKFSEVAGPIAVRHGERLRIVLVNDTMMEHPIHLHGMFVELDNGQGEFRPRKHTLNVRPAERMTLLLTADEPGRWAWHCHLLFHMHMGMFRVLEVIA